MSRRNFDNYTYPYGYLWMIRLLLHSSNSLVVLFAHSIEFQHSFINSCRFRELASTFIALIIVTSCIDFFFINKLVPLIFARHLTR